MMQTKYEPVSSKKISENKAKLQHKMQIEASVQGTIEKTVSIRESARTITDQIFAIVLEYKNIVSAQKVIEGRIEMCEKLGESLTDGEMGTSASLAKIKESLLALKQKEQNKLEKLQKEHDLELTEEIIKGIILAS